MTSPTPASWPRRSIRRRPDCPTRSASARRAVNVSSLPNLNEQTLSLPAKATPTPPIVTYTVDHPRPVIRSESTASPLLVSGNAAGVTAASGLGLLGGNPTIFYAGTLDLRPTVRQRLLSGTPTLVVTDTPPKQGWRWNGITENAGYIETATSPNDALRRPPGRSAEPLPARCPTTPSPPPCSTASTRSRRPRYGSPTQYFNDERPSAAMDGSTSTAWVLSEAPPIGQWWKVELDHPITTDHINLSQLITNRPSQLLTRVTLTFDYGDPVTVDLTHASRTPAGQTVTFSPRTFSLLRITVEAAKGTPYEVPAGYQNVTGLSEVRIPGVSVRSETVAMPEDLLRAAGTSSQADPLDLVMTRLRSSGYPPRGDEERNLARQFWLPAARTFSLVGQARISPLATDQLVGTSTGAVPTGSDPVESVASSSRMAGNVAVGAAAAIDGDPATAWQSAFSPTDQAGQWVQYTLASPLAFDTMDLSVVADGRHSIPTELRVSAGGRTEQALAAPRGRLGARGWPGSRSPCRLPSTGRSSG